MGSTDVINNLDKLDALIEPMLRAARLPGAAIAVVADGKIQLARGYGCRDLEARLPMTAATIYPIGSTTKAINATLLGMLVDEGKLAWDVPVQQYLPNFRLRDAHASTQVTLRDLVVMRTGLPRHDWLWIDVPFTRAELVERLRYLESSAGFRERFQYNNLTVTAAGHIAEVVTGRSWEELIRQRIFEPLEMHRSGFTIPEAGDFTQSYHENGARELRLSRRLTCAATGPSGGSIHSTVEDMARWMLFNLQDSELRRRLIQPRTLTEIQAPQMAARTDPSCPTPNAAYGMGWFIDTYNGRPRISHGGYIHDIHTEVSLFPADGIGIVSFVNFGFPAMARQINQHSFDALMGFTPLQSVEEKLALYEGKVAENKQRLQSVRRVPGTSPSHALADYAGTYEHPAYGTIQISHEASSLRFQRGGLDFRLQHWHYDAWVAEGADMFFLNVAHPFDRSSRILFETSVDGDIEALSMAALEPAVAPIRFVKQVAG